jgi:glutamine amidotransferase
MCRITGYLGDSIALDTLLVQPPRSLLEQARTPRDLPPGAVGSDGFGVGWIAEHDGSPARFRSTLPIWADENVDTMMPHVRASCLVASTRAASRAMPVAITNTPPFLAGDALLVHNGEVDDFGAKVLETLRAQLSGAARAHVFGNTDTEYLAALLHDRPAGNLTSRVRDTLHLVARAALEAGVTAKLNVIVADGAELVAVRFAVGARPPSLWMRSRRDGVAIASEPMEERGWEEIAENAVVTIRAASRSPVLGKM